MSPPAGASLFMRFFGLVENYPLYVMTGYACMLAAYTPVRHLLVAPDVALSREDRDYMDDLATSPRVMERAQHYEGGILGKIASFKPWPTVLGLPKDCPQEHFKFGRWPATRPMDVPKPE